MVDYCLSRIICKDTVLQWLLIALANGIIASLEESVNKQKHPATTSCFAEVSPAVPAPS
jgi:hypothetical protein